MTNLTSTINININSDVKKESTEVLNNLGINMSTAINMFLIQVARTKSIPFEVISPKPNRTLKKTLKEAKNISTGKIKTKSYHDSQDMINDILSE